MAAELPICPEVDHASVLPRGSAPPVAADRSRPRCTPVPLRWLCKHTEEVVKRVVAVSLVGFAGAICCGKPGSPALVLPDGGASTASDDKDAAVARDRARALLAKSKRQATEDGDLFVFEGDMLLVADDVP